MTPLCCAAAYVNMEVPGWLIMYEPDPRAGLSLRGKPATMASWKHSPVIVSSRNRASQSDMHT